MAQLNDAALLRDGPTQRSAAPREPTPPWDDGNSASSQADGITPSSMTPSSMIPSSLIPSSLIPSAETPGTPLVAARSELTPESAGLPHSGDVVGGTYQVLSEIGRGSMGVVLSAFDRKLERPVAIKLIRAELIQGEFRQRFLDEARVMAQINHPNVVCIHALGEHGSTPYFVMELVDGVNLEQWQRFRWGPPEVGPALQILNDVCLGVSAIHEAGAVHRDLKPSNILLDAQLRSRVADFGVSSRTEGLDRAGPAGTPGYMAPEVVFASGEGVTPRPQSDVYSLACIAYQLLTGAHPFRRANDTRSALPPRTEAIRAPSSVRPELPTSFDRVLLQALEWDVEARTPSVEAFRQALHRAHEGCDTPERIVVAEDDREFCELIELCLRQAFPGADIECVDNGLAALAAVERRPASVAIVDLQMPAMDGVTLTAQLRKRPDCGAMPIIVLTACGGAREWQRLSTIGADRFLVKPVQLDDVVTFIRQALRERGGHKPPSVPPSSRSTQLRAK